MLLVAMLLTGYPVAFCFAGTSVAFAGLGVALGAFSGSDLRFMSQRWFGSASDPILLAIPFFVFMGAVLEKSGLAERLLTTVGLLLGKVRGGLALTVVVVGSLLAAATGVVAATVIVMGMISLPTMIKQRYDHRLATGVIAASGTLAQLLPPSLVLIVLASVAGVGVGDLFVGALIPGLILTTLYGLYIVYVGWRHPERVPLLAEEDRTLHGKALALEAVKAVVPPILLILAVLGSIFFGLVFPTEAGAVGAVGAMVLAAFNRTLTWKMVKDAGQATANVTTLVMIILLASTFFSLVFDRLGGQRLATEWLTGLPGGFWGFLIIANIAVFLLGINLEFLEISFIALPILMPAVNELGIDPIWFLVLMAINLNIAFISPPVGFSLFYLQSVAPPEVKTFDIHRGAIPFMGLQATALMIVMLVPQTVTWLVDASASTGA
ncbi:MAG TPA: TRAP transporter large permease subunit [Euzebya sp.]|nr:TRAP transporter large permease subunit [Euzebya sp.]